MLKGRLISDSVVIAEVDEMRRHDIMRNHTATHLLHANLRKVLGEQVRQAGSLVAPDRLRFDFTNSKAMTSQELKDVEYLVNQEILKSYPLKITQKKLSQALEEGATALFGEKYGDEVRTIEIGGNSKISYELCGGTHVQNTSDVGLFIITSEGSAAAGIRRIEAISGRMAYEYISKQLLILSGLKATLNTTAENLQESVDRLIKEKTDLIEQISQFGKATIQNQYETEKSKIRVINGVNWFSMVVNNGSVDALRDLADLFRRDHPSGVALFANIDSSKNIQLIATVTEDLVKSGISAGTIIKKAATEIGGSGGGRPQLAQGGGTNIEKLRNLLEDPVKLIN
jgi:alanyl-tRNA synthetase